MSRAEDPLLLEAQRVDYGLRSTFFYRKLNELGFMDFGSHIDELAQVAGSYRWEMRAEWSISETAWEQIRGADIEPVRAFAHPLVLIQNPRRIAYYRNVAAISQKGAKTLGVRNLERFESGSNTNLPEGLSAVACRLFNTHISSIIDSTINFSRRDIDALLMASAGAQIDGAWRNAIGKEAESLIKRLLISEFRKRDRISAFQARNGKDVPVSEIQEADVISNLEKYRGFTLVNGTAVIFSSEPDISLRLASGKLDAAVEVKGGKDTAGAIERFGAAQKSFIEAQNENPFVHTILDASCITPEVANRIEEARKLNRLFHEVVNLSELLASEDARSEFAVSLLQRLGAA